MLHDLRHLLGSSPPRPDEWNKDLRKEFSKNVKNFSQLLYWMHGMDHFERQVGYTKRN